MFFNPTVKDLLVWFTELCPQICAMWGVVLCLGVGTSPWPRKRWVITTSVGCMQDTSTGTSANICGLLSRSHMWERCSPDCKEEASGKIIGWYSSTEDIRLTGSVVE